MTTNAQGGRMEKLIAELDALEAKATEGPYYVGPDDAEDCPSHARSGLAVIDTGRLGDWPVARLCEWPTAEFIAALRNAWPQLRAMLTTPVAEAVAGDGPHEWRCFHCDEVFTDNETAAAHFGSEIDEPGCKLNALEGGLLKLMRESVDAWRNYCSDEVGSTAKEFYALSAAHAVALRREEEKGYERGLADGRALPASPADTRETAHTDHPSRVWDMTCPACLADRESGLTERHQYCPDETGICFRDAEGLAHECPNIPPPAAPALPEATREPTKAQLLEIFKLGAELTGNPSDGWLEVWRNGHARALSSSAKAAREELPSGKLAVMGEIETGPGEKWPMALLITFKTVEELRAAMDQGRCQYTFAGQREHP